MAFSNNWNRKNNKLNRNQIYCFIILLITLFIVDISFTSRYELNYQKENNNLDNKNFYQIASISNPTNEVIKKIVWGNETYNGSVEDSLFTKDNQYFYSMGYVDNATFGVQAIVVKYNIDGTQIWNITFGGLESDVARCGVLSSNESVLYVTVLSQMSSVDIDMFIVKIDTINGIILGYETWGYDYQDDFQDICISSDDLFVYISGSCNETGTDMDSVIVKFNAYSLEQIWNSTFGGIYDDMLYAITINSTDDGVFVAGNSKNGLNPSDMRLAIYKFDDSGNMIWDEFVSVNGDICTYYDLVLSNTDEKFYVVGTTSSDGTNYKILIDSYYENGTLEWSKTWFNDFYGFSFDLGRSITRSSDGESILICGNSIDFLSGSVNIIYMQYDINSTQLWNDTILVDISGDFSYSNDIEITSDNGKIIISSQVTNTNLNGTIHIIDTHLPLSTPTLEADVSTSYNGTINLSWTNITRANNYTLYINRTTDIIDLYQDNATYGIEDDNFTLYGLSYGDYYFSVVACSDDGNSSLSNSIKVEVRSIFLTIYHIESTPDNDGTVFIQWSENATYNVRTYVFRERDEITDVSSLNHIAIVNDDTYYVDLNVPTGEWWYAIVGNDGGTGNTTVSNSVNTTVEHYPATPNLGQPVEYSINRTIELDWDDDLYTDSYYIYRDSIGGAFVPGYTTPLAIITDSNYTDFSVTPGTWFYAVAGYNETGFGELSNLRTVIGYEHCPLPSNLDSLPAISINREVDLTWDTSDGAIGYYIFRSSSPITEKPDVALDYTTNEYYTDIGMDLGLWYYCIVAENSTGNSSISNNVNTVVEDLPETPVITPIPDIVYENITIYVSWGSVPNIDGYLLYVDDVPINTGDAELLTPLYNGTNTYFSHPAIPGDNYYLCIAYNSTGNSTYDLGDNEYVQVLYYPPEPSMTILAGVTVGEAGSTDVVLDWNDMGSFYYRVYRYTADFDNSTIALTQYLGETGLGITTFTDSNVPLGLWYYGVGAVNGTGQGNVSSTVFTTVQHTPISPILDSITGIILNNSANLTWNNVPTATYYNVYRDTSPINDGNIGLLSPIGFNTSTQYLDLDVPVGIYYYVITSVNGTGESGPSNCIQVDFQNLPDAPTILEVTGVILPEFVPINWTRSLLATSYRLYRSTSEITSSNIGLLTPILITSSNTTIDNTGDGGIYYYAVIAYNSTGYSDVSVNIIVSVVFYPSIPSDLEANPNPVPIYTIDGNNSAILTWTNGGHADFFYIYINISDFTSVNYMDYIANTTQNYFTLENLEYGTYYLAIIAGNQYLNSSLSNRVQIIVDVTPPAPYIRNFYFKKNIGVIIVWEPMEDVIGYYVYRSNQPITSNQDIIDQKLEPINSELITQLNSTYTDISCGEGMQYYVVVAVNDIGEGLISNLIEIECSKQMDFTWAIYVGIAAVSIIGGFGGFKLYKKWKDSPQRIFRQDDSFAKNFNAKDFDWDD